MNSQFPQSTNRDLIDRLRYSVCFPFLIICLCCPVVYAQNPLFQLLAPKQTHIDFKNDIDENESLNVLSYEYFYNGGGVAVGDINNDGLLDLFFTANLKANKLYLNLGKLTFKDITSEAGAQLGGRAGGWKTGVSMADVNGDGWLDIYVCYSGKGDESKRRNQLFINQGAGPKGMVRFVEQAKEYGVDDNGYNTQATFFDYDRDGDLDLFLLHHNVKKYDNMELAKLHGETDLLAGNKLLENRNGHFVDVSQKEGIHQYPLTFGLGMAVADVNKDGWPDIYVTNDYNEPDYLYINQKGIDLAARRSGEPAFKDETQSYFRHLAQFSMGVDIADYNNDGLPDIMSLDMLPEDNRRQKLLQLQENYESFELMQQQKLQRQYMRNMLQLNNGDGTFSEIAQTAGVSNTDWSWSPLLADFDNDGYKDLFITNGYLRDYTNKDFLKYWGDYKIKKAIDREPVQLMDLVKAMPSTKIANYIFSNNHDLTFTNKQREWGFQTPSISNGAVYADLDNDGDLELVVNNINEPAFVYQNMSREQSANGFLQVKLVPSGKNRTAIGAKVTLFANGNLQYQEVNPVRGYLSSQPLTLHFGVGTASRADSINIIWPDQSVQKLTGVPVNQQLVVQQQATPASVSQAAVQKMASPVFTKVDPVLAHTHEGFLENDFKRQPLMLWMYSHTGPILAKGDINKDGLDDVFISGDQNKPGSIWKQQTNGTFKQVEGLVIGDESISSVSAAVFFDANGDGYDDLYVAKGGYSLFEINTTSFQDELYMNDGKGNLTLAKTALPNLAASSKACVRPYDYDQDGDIDLFVGGRVVPGRYPEAPVSYLLQNTGTGQFRAVPIPFAKIGMVTDVKWADMNGDGRADLVLCGEFMPIKIYLNTKDGFVDKTKQYFPEEEKGFWLSLTIADVNGDGQNDILAGNLGTNSQIKYSSKEPVELVYADFDNNGSIDPFVSFYVQGTSYPFVSRDELNDQIYAMRKKFAFYKDYANATISTILPADDLANAPKLTATECHSVCFLSKKGQFEKQILPIEAQFAPVTNMLCEDFDRDGQLDVLLLGNKSDNRLKLGSMDANYGCLLKGDGKGGFTYVSQPASGLSVIGDVKSVVDIGINQNRCLLIGAFNQPLQVYKKQKL
ncbi:VCBS repeat-containing protein [Spirosoma linguale]|uniref:ASPIC/UnbV domain protein n=1 Tax=Spirosoma linguale (strain ATCC 33905 / DSM 74 / LMG 10896 / Claus 1) TaxID=504472 RepID=D2QL98_SPILD|nr:ASPIC/UnbV domain protein [Spirosoma linguale DSM 74]